MPTEQQLRDESEEAIDALERGANQVREEFRQVLNRFYRDVRARAAELNRIDFATVSEYEQAVIQFFEDAGGEELIGNYLDTMISLEDRAIAYYNLFGVQPRLNQEAAEQLNLLIEYHETNLREIVDDRLIRPVRNSILIANTQSRTGTEFVGVIREEVDRLGIKTADGREFTDTQIETQIREGIVQYNQEVNNRVAEEVGFKIYFYAGPLDAKNRPACEAIKSEAPHGVPAYYYADEIAAMQGRYNLPFPALSGRGGWNCRHNWRAVSLEFAVEQGFVPRG